MKGMMKAEYHGKEDRSLEGFMELVVYIQRNFAEVKHPNMRPLHGISDEYRILTISYAVDI